MNPNTGTGHLEPHPPFEYCGNPPAWPPGLPSPPLSAATCTKRTKRCIRPQCSAIQSYACISSSWLPSPVTTMWTRIRKSLMKNTRPWRPFTCYSSDCNIELYRTTSEHGQLCCPKSVGLTWKCHGKVIVLRGPWSACMVLMVICVQLCGLNTTNTKHSFVLESTLASNVHTRPFHVAWFGQT